MDTPEKRAEKRQRLEAARAEQKAKAKAAAAAAKGKKGKKGKHKFHRYLELDAELSGSDSGDEDMDVRAAGARTRYELSCAFVVVSVTVFLFFPHAVLTATRTCSVVILHLSFVASFRMRTWTAASQSLLTMERPVSRIELHRRCCPAVCLTCRSGAARVVPQAWKDVACTPCRCCLA